PWEPPGQPHRGQPPGTPPPGGPPAWGPPGGPGGGPGPYPAAPYPPTPYPLLPKAGSARTGPLPLHPMMFSDLLDGSFRLLKANLGAIVLVGAVFLIPVNLVGALQGASVLEEAAGPAASNAPLIGSVVAGLVTILVTPFIGGATAMIVAASYLGGGLKAGPALGGPGGGFWVLLAVFFLTLLLKGAGLVLCLVGALIPMTLFLVTTPTVMLEEAGPIQTMARSVVLVRPRFWPVMGIGVASGILASVLGNILATPFSVAALAVGYRWGWILAAIGALLPALVTTPFVSILATLVYFDLRIRNEGFDLQMIAADLARGAPARCPRPLPPPARRPARVGRR